MFVTGNSRILLFVSNKYRARTINLIGIKIKFIILNKNRWKILLHVGYEFIYTRTTSIPINNGSLSINISRFYEFHPIEINYQFVSSCLRSFFFIHEFDFSVSKIISNSSTFSLKIFLTWNWKEKKKTKNLKDHPNLLNTRFLILRKQIENESSNKTKKKE